VLFNYYLSTRASGNYDNINLFHFKHSRIYHKYIQSFSLSISKFY
jgi:hypothetical protein